MEAEPLISSRESLRVPSIPVGALYFLHIPKTGGTSLCAWLESRFARDEVCPWHDLNQVLTAPTERLAGYRFLRGHHGMYLPRLLGAPLHIMTLLRDPLSRSVSHYRDIVARVGHPLHGRVRGMSFEQFVLAEEGEAELLNLQCRYLAFDDVEADYLGHRRMLAADMGRMRSKYTERELLDRATAALRSFLVVGVCERVDEAAGRIAAKLGWPAPGPLPRLNAGTAPFGVEELTARAIARVRELTALDQELYVGVARRSGEVAPARPSHIPS